MADQRLVSVFKATLDADKGVRAAAETALAEAYRDPNVAIPLLGTLTDGSVNQFVRQAAGVGFQKYIGAHWSAAADKFQPPLVPQELRPRIREILFHTLGEENDQIRRAAAYSVALIGRYDYPEQWPTLMNDLIILLRQDSTDTLEGAMQVISDLVMESLDESQLPALTAELLPALMVILKNENLSWDLRCTPIKIFEEIMRMLSNVREEHPQMVKQAMERVGPEWMQEFGRIISVEIEVDVTRDPGLLGLRNHVYSVFSLLEKESSKFFASYRQQAVTLAVHNLVCLMPYSDTYCISTNQARPILPDNYDEELIFGTLTLEIIWFLEHSTRPKSVKPLLIEAKDDQERATSMLVQMISATASLMQITSRELEEWDDQPELFVADAEDEDAPYNARTAGYDLIGSLIDSYPRPVAVVLQDVLVRVVQESMAKRSENPASDWWQALEAVMALLGAIGDDIRGILEEDTKLGLSPTIQLTQLYVEVVAQLLHAGDQPAIQGRAFMFAGSFAGVLPKEAVDAAFNSTISALKSGIDDLAVQLSAIKAIKLFCRHVEPSLIQPHSQQIIELLLTNIEDTKNEPLYLILETLRAILAVDKDGLNNGTDTETAEVVYKAWLDNATDPIATALVEELFEAIVSGSSPAAIRGLVVHLCPRLAATITSNPVVDGVSIAGEALQLVNSLIRTRGGPLEPELIATATSAIMGTLMTTGDMDVVQHGLLHITQIVRKDCDKLLQWRDVDGTTGINRIFQLLARFLAPDFSETGAIFVGDLIIHLFRKASESIGPILPDLLQTLVTRLVHAKLPSFIEALVLPFAYLFSTEHTQATLDLLASFPPPQGCSDPSALQLVLRTWCEITDEIGGSWNIRVSALGLARVFVTPHPMLREVVVRGDLVITEANRDTIMTRSRTKSSPNQYTAAPFPLKALKLILKELQSYKSTGAGKGKGKQVDNSAFDNLEEDDGDEEWDDDDDLGGAGSKGEFDFLSSWLDEGGGGEHDAQDDDEDLRHDPLAQIDMVDHLTQVLRHCYTTDENGIHEMIGGLTDVEKGILRGVLTV